MGKDFGVNEDYLIKETLIAPYLTHLDKRLAVLS